MDTQHILLVEDDQRLAQLTKEYLEKFGFDVAHVLDGEQAVGFVEKHSPDLILLDLLLPKLDGFEVCKRVRPHFQGSIIMLTALDDDVDQIVGLETGADDYIAKPVEPRLLLARIKSHLRRQQTLTSLERNAKPTSNTKAASDHLDFDKLSIHPPSRSVTLNQAPLSLTTQEFDLLLLMAERSGQVLSRDYIYQSLLGLEYNGVDRSVDILISRLRKLLQSDHDTQQIIKTVRNQGYLFTLQRLTR